MGHKGIGKSALFQIAIHEDRQANNLPIEVRPDDVKGIALHSTNLLQQVDAWKEGLREILQAKVLNEFTIGGHHVVAKAAKAGGKFLNYLADTLEPLLRDKADLDPSKKLALEIFLATRKIIVYMDDLDRGWQGRPEDILRISALLNAIRDLSRDNDGLHFRVSLRSDVYFLVRTSDESTDKIGGSVIWYAWTNFEILALLVKRVETFFGRPAAESKLLALDQSELAEYLTPVITSRFEGEGKWANAPMYRVLMSMIRRRPRDLVKLLTLAARKANHDGLPLIDTSHLRSVFEEYSNDRMQDAINEYRYEFPDVRRLLFGMKPNRIERRARAGFLYKTDDLLKKIQAIQEGAPFKDATGRNLESREVAAFMYKINFIIASKDRADGYINRRYFEESRYLASTFADFGYDWEIHPAYRWALQPDTLETIYELLRLSADD